MSIPAPLRPVIRTVLESELVGRLSTRYVSNRGIVFTLHRFACEENGFCGDSPETIRAVLAHFRNIGASLVTLDALMEAQVTNRSVRRPQIAVTVDDGYADFLHVGVPLFNEFDCPATVFVSTGPVDRSCWFWWDQIHYLFTCTKRRGFTMETEGRAQSFAWSNPATRDAALLSCVEGCKQLRIEERDAWIRTLGHLLDVELPLRAPPAYASMTWDDVRQCQSRGMQVGAHTVTHPILSMCTPEREAQEVLASVMRLREECADDVGMFAYPNGRPQDFTEHATHALAQAGVRMAVTTSPGSIALGRPSSTQPLDTYRVPRNAFPLTRASAMRTVLFS